MLRTSLATLCFWLLLAKGCFSADIDSLTAQGIEDVQFALEHLSGINGHSDIENRALRKFRRRQKRRNRKKKKAVRPAPTRRPTPNPTPKPTPKPTRAPVQPELRSPEPASGFQITLVNMGTQTRYDDIMKRAAARWERVVGGDLRDIGKQRNPNFSWFGGHFEGRKYNEPVDDVVIGYSFPFIDGPGRVLGRAGPIFARGNAKTGPYSTISAMMQFDDADMKRRSASDIESIMVHEIGHCLGIGTINKVQCAPACKASLTGGKASNPQYDSIKCPNAGREATRMGLINSPEELQMEPRGGPGSACGHIQDIFTSPGWSDVMTATFNARKAQLLTRVDLGALQDLGGYSGIRMSSADVPRTQRLRRVETGNTTTLATDTSFTLHHSDATDTKSWIYIEDI